MLPEEAREQFVSTLEEWHYLINGFASGLIVGFLVGVYVTYKLLKTRARN